MAQTILVVDGEEVIREIVASMLKLGGYECRGTSNGFAAIGLLRTGEKIDLILSELMMSEMDGIQLLERVKEKYPGLPVVFVTAVYDESVVKAAMSSGACDYLLKPFEREQLLATVRRALNSGVQTAAHREEVVARVCREIEVSKKKWEEEKGRPQQNRPVDVPR